LGRAGKTISHYAEALSAFCDWCVAREYLADDPLKALASFDTTPQTLRRAMTAEEISRLLNVCPPHHSLLLEAAFLSGLRANELRNLSIRDLDLEENGLHLDASWTKNRKKGFQPIAEDLAHRLYAFALSGEPTRLYAKFYGRKGTKLTAPDNPLLYVPSHTARDLDRYLKAADIPKETADGKLDFHACRLAYINLLLESGASVKEAQTLARHSTPELTMNVYGQTRKDRLAETAEEVAANLLPSLQQRRCSAGPLSQPSCPDAVARVFAMDVALCGAAVAGFVWSR
jgi:integrase